MTLFFIAIGALAATLLGGLFAIRFSDKLHLVLGFSAGAVVAVAFFDLLPEAIELGSSAYETSTILLYTAIGFALYMILDRAFHLHAHSHDEHDHCGNAQHGRGLLGAGSLSVHSFMDGVAVGLAFQVSPAIGVVVAAAVLAHDFSDGINTVSVILKNGGTKRLAFKWLLVDALAPVVGIVIGSMISIDESLFAPLLALFAGFFLYLGASDLLPESHHSHPTFWTTFASIVGMVVIYSVLQIAAF